MHQQIKNATMALCLGMMCSTAFAQSRQVTGTVKDEAGEPMIGVSVRVDGTSIGAVTDLDGHFTIKNVPDKASLTVSYVGYRDQKLKAGGNNYQVVLTEDKQNLDEVVVIGYGVQKKKDLTGSVASIKSEDIQNVASSDALQAMQAKVPGLDLTKTSGQAGASVNMTLRGNRSISASNSPLILVDGVEYGSTIDIPSTDIESVDILKDAASTAIYGTKGANGVIIITTKRGKAGKTRVNFNAYLSFNSPTSMVKGMYGTREVRRFVDRANYQADLASGNWGSSNLTADDLNIWMTLEDGTSQLDIIHDGSYTDWYDTFMQNSTTQNYEASVSGGNEKTTFSASAAAMYDKGLLKHDALDRYNGRLNLDHQINRVVRVGMSTAFTYKSHDYRAALFNAARKMTSITHAYRSDNGEIYETPNPMYPAHVNPLMDEGQNYQRNRETTRFIGSAYIQLTPVKGLTAKSLFSVDRTNRRNGQYNDYQSVSNYQSAGPSTIENGYDAVTTLDWQNTVNYALELNEKHAFNFLLGHEMSQTVSEGLDVNGSTLKEHYYKSSFYDVSKILAPAATSSYTKHSLLSFFGRVNYSYLSRYLFSASLRADGSSVLAKGHKWGWFPSASAGWRISEEEFMKPTTSWLSNLKLRLSWGLSGNAAVNPYQTLATLTAATDGGTDMIPMSMANPDLSWEKTSAWNIGLDFGFLNGRISGAVDYYITHTYDLLYPKSAPATSVFTSVLSNVGKTKGHGVEVSVSAIPVQTKDFQWTIDANYTHSHDEVDELADGLDRNILAYNNALIVGKPVSIFYDYETNGCWGVGEYDKYVADMAAKGITVESPISNYGQPGTVRIVDQNGDGKIDADNDRIAYQRTPKHIFGLTNTLRYRDFSLSVQAMARLGGYMAYEANNNIGLDDGDANWANVDYWTYTNQGAKLPNPGSDSKVYGAYKTALLYEKSDFLKIKDITLSYNLPKSVLAKAYISNARIYCSLKNFITFSKVDDYDAELNGTINWPLAKQVVVGVNLTF